MAPKGHKALRARRQGFSSHSTCQAHRQRFRSVSMVLAPLPACTRTPGRTSMVSFVRQAELSRRLTFLEAFILIPSRLMALAQSPERIGPTSTPVSFAVHRNVTTFNFPGANNPTIPTGFNGEGDIVGYHFDGPLGAIPHSFIRTADGSFTSFDPPGVIEGSVAAGIDPSETIVGYYSSPSNRGYLRSASGAITLLDVPGASGTQPAAINGMGVVLGTYFDASNVVHGFSRSPSLPHRFAMFDPPGSTLTSPVAISAAGVIVGNYQDTNGTSHGFLRNP